MAGRGNPGHPATWSRKVIAGQLLSRVVSLSAARMRGGHVAAALLAVVVAAAGCTSGHPSASHSQVPSVHVSPGHAATLRIADGWEVTIPAGSVAGSGTLSAKTIAAPAAPPSGLALAGPVLDLQLSGTVLTGLVRLTAPVPLPKASASVAPRPDAALLAYYDSAGGGWQPVNASYDSAVHVLTATSPHLSTWSVLVVDTSQVLAAARSALAGFLGVAELAPPSCPGASELASLGVTVTSADSGDMVKWCAGVNGTGSPVIRVTDNRNYGIELDYPANWQMSRLGSPDPVFDQIISSLPTLSVYATTPQVRAITIAPGQTVELRPAQVEVEEATAYVGLQSIFINAFLYAVDTAELVGGLIAKSLKIGQVAASTVVQAVLKSKDCLTEFDALLNGPSPTAAATAGELFRSAADLVTGCLGQVWPALYGRQGAAGAFDASVILWLADGEKQILVDSEAAIDTTMHPAGYHIMFASLPGHWQQDSTLTDPTTGDIQSIAVGPDSLLATGHFDGSSYLWNLASSQRIGTITEPITNADLAGDNVESLAFSPDGKTLAAGLGKGLIGLRGVATTITIASFDDGYGQGGVSSLAFSPDGKTLAAGDLGSRGAFLWDVATGNKLALLSTRIGAITAVAFSPDGKLLAVGGDDGTVLWDVATMQTVATFGISGSGPIVSVAFSPDGRLLATGGFKGAVLWDLSTGRQTATLPDPALAGATNSVAFNLDGNVLATAGTSICLWDTVTGNKIATINAAADSVVFGPGGQTLATAAGHSLIIWAPAS
jgi:WD40 repeat protein